MGVGSKTKNKNEGCASTKLHHRNRASVWNRSVVSGSNPFAPFEPKAVMTKRQGVRVQFQNETNEDSPHMHAHVCAKYSFCYQSEDTSTKWRHFGWSAELKVLFEG